MKKKNCMFLSFMAACLALVGTACGGSDDPDVAEVPAPTFVSVTPADGATDVPTGNVSITVLFDQNIFFVSSNATRISITGGTISSAHADGKQLVIAANCPNEGTKVTVTIPAGLVVNTQKREAAQVSFSFTTHETPAPVEDGHEVAAVAVKNMIAGWNLGNTLDAWNAGLGNNQAPSKYETCWGQPQADAHLMRAFKEKGFTAIRVPVTWFQNMDDNNQVNEAWMARVEEVVNYVLDAGMYCILNVHHDTGAGTQAWLKADVSAFDAANPRFVALWKQIANRFNKYGEKLLFEGYNEMLYGSDPNAQWSEPRDLNNLQAINKYAQSFVNTVRATGGNNAWRNLIVTTYSASHTQNTLNGFVVPTDPCGNQSHLAIEVHSYDPWDWVNTYNMKWTSQCTAEITRLFSDLNACFITKGYPVIIGEYGSNGNGEKTINKSSTDAQKQEAGRQAADMTRLCKKYGAAAFYWMGIVDGQDRAESTFKWSMEQVADSIVTVARQ